MPRKTALAGATTLLALAIAMPAAAQVGGAGARLDAKLTPGAAGTEQRPKGVKLRVQAGWDHAAGTVPRTIAETTTWLPRGLRFNGGDHPACARWTLSREGPAGCPRKSVMGKGTAVARADGVQTKPRVVVVNGGPRRIWLQTTLSRPSLVRQPVPVVIEPRRGRWSYSAHVVVPRTLQVVGGVPIGLTELRVTAGRGSWLATTGCPRSRRWRMKLTTTFTDGASATAGDAVPCRRR